MQRILEVIASIPNLIVVILFVLILNHPFGQLYYMSITGWLGMSRVVRGEFLKLKIKSLSWLRKHWGFKIQIDI